jgi:ABC-type dipeptide/oligopeptide/nickel transport system ATPase subunit
MPPPRRGRGRGRGAGRGPSGREAVSTGGAAEEAIDDSPAASPGSPALPAASGGIPSDAPSTAAAVGASSASSTTGAAAASAVAAQAALQHFNPADKASRERVEEVVSAVVAGVVRDRFGAAGAAAFASLLPYMVEMMVQDKASLTSADLLEAGPGQFLVSSGVCSGSGEGSDARWICGAVVERLTRDMSKLAVAAAGSRGPVKLEKSVAIDEALKEAAQQYRNQAAVFQGAASDVSKWTKQKQAGALNAVTDKAARAALRKQKREEALREKQRLKATFEVEESYGFDFGPVNPNTTVLRNDLATDVVLERFDLAHKKDDGTDLLTNASLTIARGRRYGLIGRNGCGKSTFFDAVVKRQIEGVPRDCLVMSTKQHVKGDDRTPLQWLLQAAPQHAALQVRARDLRRAIQVEELRQRQAKELAELDKAAGEDGEDAEEEEEADEEEEEEAGEGQGEQEQEQERESKDSGGGGGRGRGGGRGARGRGRGGGGGGEGRGRGAVTAGGGGGGGGGRGGGGGGGASAKTNAKAADGGGGPAAVAAGNSASEADVARADQEKLQQMRERLREAEEELDILNETQGAEETRARVILRGLGFSEEQLARTATNHLSGGWVAAERSASVFVFF